MNKDERNKFIPMPTIEQLYIFRFKTIHDALKILNKAREFWLSPRMTFGAAAFKDIEWVVWNFINKKRLQEKDKVA